MERRDFVKVSSLGVTALSASRVLGANDRLKSHSSAVAVAAAMWRRRCGKRRTSRIRPSLTFTRPMARRSPMGRCRRQVFPGLPQGP